jgi:hypothetical protein
MDNGVLGRNNGCSGTKANLFEKMKLTLAHAFKLYFKSFEW